MNLIQAQFRDFIVWKQTQTKLKKQPVISS